MVIAGNSAPDFTAVAENLPEDYGDVAESFREARRVLFDRKAEVFTDDWAPIYDSRKVWLVSILWPNIIDFC